MWKCSCSILMISSHPIQDVTWHRAQFSFVAGIISIMECGAAFRVGAIERWNTWWDFAFGEYWVLVFGSFDLGAPYSLVVDGFLLFFWLALMM
jgi:hypothetical protein